MRIHSITLESFKGVRDRTVEFPDTGITVLQGRNESGKSSTLEAFDLLLDAPDNSGKKDVKAAAPVGQDIGVAVTAEFTLEGHRLRYRKQWLRSRETTLRFLEGPRAGDMLSGREAHDAVAELRAQTDETLWNALRLLQSGRSGSGSLTESTALKSALEKVSGGAAQSAEGSSLLSAAQAERDRYWTATGKENAATSALRRRHEAAVEAHRETSQAMERLIEAEDALERAGRSVATAQRQHAAAVSEAEESQREAEDLERLKAQRDQAATAVEIAQAQAERSVKDQTERRTLVEQAQAARTRSQELAEQARALQEKVEAAETVAEQARDAVEAAQSQEEQARLRTRAIRTAQRRVQDRERLRELTALLEQLDGFAAARAALEQRPSTELTQEAATEIEAAERAVETARTQLEAGSAQVTLTALGGSRALVVGGESLELDPDAPQELAVTETIDVELPGQLRVSVAPEQGREERRERLERAEQELASLRQRWEVESSAQAREQLREQAETQRELQSVEEKRRLVLGTDDEAQLHRELERLQEMDRSAESDAEPGSESESGSSAGSGSGPMAEPVSDPSSEPPTELPTDLRFEDPAQAQEALDQAEEQAEIAREALRSAQDAAISAEAELAGRRQEHGALQATRTAQDQTAADQEARLQELRDHLADAALEERAQQQARELSEAQETSAALDRRWEEQEGDQALVHLRAKARRPESLRAALDRAREERSRAEGTLGGLDRDARQAAYDRALTERGSVGRELASHLRRAAAAKLLVQTLEDFQAEELRRYTAPFRKRLEALGSHVFGTTFQIELNDDLEITRRYMNGSWIEESSLSTGAREQLAVLVRLAVSLLVDPQDGVPVILDDALGHSDPDRLASLAEALTSAGKSAQVILLTATPDRFAALEGARVVPIDG